MNPRDLLLPPRAVLGDAGSRHQFGLRSLEKRYIRRAVSLARDDDFRRTIRECRDQWNSDHPRWPVRPGSQPTVSGLPDALERDAGDEIAKFFEDASTLKAYRDQGVAVPAHGAQLRLMASLHAQEVEGRIAWGQMTDDLIAEFFPDDRFPAPDPRTHPAERFIVSCLHADTEALEALDAKECFDDATLTLTPVRRGDDVCLPLYPGVTAEDIRRQADQIATANRRYAHSQPTSIARRLRDEGASLGTIADALGISKTAVHKLLAE